MHGMLSGYRDTTSWRPECGHTPFMDKNEKARLRGKIVRVIDSVPIGKHLLVGCIMCPCRYVVSGFNEGWFRIEEHDGTSLSIVEGSTYIIVPYTWLVPTNEKELL